MDFNNQNNQQTANVAGTANAGGAGATDDVKNASNNQDAQGAEEELLFSQADVDSLIEKRIKREKKKLQNMENELKALKQSMLSLNSNSNQAGSAQSTQQQPTQTPNMDATVLDILKKLGVVKEESQTKSQPNTSKVFMKALKADAKATALSLGVSAEFVDDVITLARLDDIEIDSDGEYDEEDVAKAIKNVIKKHKMFAKVTDNPPAKAGSVNVGNQNNVKTLADTNPRLAALSERFGKNQK